MTIGASSISSAELSLEETSPTSWVSSLLFWIVSSCSWRSELPPKPQRKNNCVILSKRPDSEIIGTQMNQANKETATTPKMIPTKPGTPAPTGSVPRSTAKMDTKAAYGAFLNAHMKIFTLEWTR